MAAPIGPGDWVECVDARPGDWTGDDLGLIVGALYRVRTVLDAQAPDGHFRPSLRFYDLASPRSVTGGESSFDAARFRPIYRPRADLIESLKAPPERVGEPA